MILEAFHVQLVAKDGSNLGTDYEQVCRGLEALGSEETTVIQPLSAESASRERPPANARLQLELDGSFVCVGDDWQLDGMLYDIAERLQYVDLKGSCPKAFWTRLVEILTSSTSAAVVVKLPQGGLYDLQSFEASTWT